MITEKTRSSKSSAFPNRRLEWLLRFLSKALKKLKTQKRRERFKELIKPLTHLSLFPSPSSYSGRFLFVSSPLFPPPLLSNPPQSFWFLSISFLYISRSNNSFLYLVIGAHIVWVSRIHGNRCIYLYICEPRSREWTKKKIPTYIYIYKREGEEKEKKRFLEHYKKKNVKVVDGHRTFNNLGFSLLISSFFLLRAVLDRGKGRKGDASGGEISLHACDLSNILYWMKNLSLT